MNAKILSVLCLLALVLVSCKKDLTCSCTMTETSSGTSYGFDYMINSWGDYDYFQTTDPLSSESNTSTSEENYKDASKGAVSAQCPEKYVSTDEFDNTYSTGYTDYITGQSIIQGSKGKTTYTRTCEIKKD
ncbi:MAG: hypothetical protein ACKOW8_03385 [Flavobacteriales bacterium]